MTAARAKATFVDMEIFSGAALQSLTRPDGVLFFAHACLLETGVGGLPKRCSQQIFNGLAEVVACQASPLGDGLLVSWFSQFCELFSVS